MSNPTAAQASRPAVFQGPGPEAEYRRRLGEGRFEIQQCGACGRHFFYPRVTCRYCGSADVHWVRPSGRATVYSTTVVRQRPENGGDYNVAIVELAEGPRMMTRIEEIAPAEVRIGMAVTPRIDGAGESAVLVFVPAGAAGTQTAQRKEHQQ
jgi:uncharacterized OB-fold protein